MATIIQIKRSANVTAPSTADLLEAELAYSQDKSNDGAGAILYIESLDSTDSEVIHKVGGKYYTDIVDGATDAATANKLVKRDANGSFSANNITATTINGTVVGALAGEAASAVIANTANALTTARKITLAGDLSGNVTFDGSSDVTLTATVEATSVNLYTDTTGDYVANLTQGTGVTITGGTGHGSSATIEIGQDVGTSAAVTFGSVTAPLYGQANSAVIANTANTLTTGRYIKLAGDVVGQAFFDGSGNAEINATVIQANSVELGVDTTGDYIANLTAGTGIEYTNLGGEGANVTINLTDTGVVAALYGSTTNIPVITVDAQGRITSAANASISTTLGVAGDSGADNVELGQEVLHFTGGTGISTSVAGNAVTISNDGVLSVATGFGLSVDNATGAITIDNTGVTRAIAGTGIGVDSETGNVTLTNLGVVSLTGTTHEITVSSANGAVTIGLPDDVTIGKDLTVVGNLFVQGNVTTIGTVDLRVDDPLIYLAGNNYSSDAVDIGFIGNYYDGSSQRHAGLFRDASDSGLFKLFANLQPEPNTGVIDTGNASFTIATLVSNITGGTVSGLTANIAVGDGGTGRGTLTTNAVLYGQGTSAVGLATGTFGQVLQINDTGVPVFAGIDGGTY